MVKGGLRLALASAASLAALACTIVLTGCAAAAPPDAASTTDAQSLLKSAVLPHDAHGVGARPAGAPANPFSKPVCTPLEDASEFLTSSTDLDTLSTWIKQHPAPGLTSNGFGSMNGPSTAGSDGRQLWVEQQPAAASTTRGKGRHEAPQLSFTMVCLADTTIIRVDAIVVPPGAQCASAG